MPDFEYQLFFDNAPASTELVERIAEITVEQEVCLAWEARIKLPITVDERGNWRAEGGELADSITRARVEIRVGGSSFAPLIDGPIVGFDCQMSAQPGQSNMILIVQDDSVYLNREEAVVQYENLLDHEIAQQIFSQFSQIAATNVESTNASGSALPPVVYQRGTAMQLLRSLAKRQGMCAHVLPGVSSGQSVGVFKAFPTQPDGLPALVLLGADRNLESFNVKYDAQSPAAVRNAILRVTDKRVATGRSSSNDAEALGDQSAAAQAGSNLTTQLLPPDIGETVDPERAVAAAALHASFAFEASGQLRNGAYTAILQPYRVVTLQAGNTALSGDYIITSVTHKLNRSEYTQSFSLKRNARSAGDAANQPLGSIF